MGPPRLSLVSGAGKPAGDDHAAGKVAAPANDAVGPVEEPAAQGSSTSPVHDLINSIETRTSTAAVEPPAEPSLELRENLRILEAVIFAAAEPLDEPAVARRA